MSAAEQPGWPKFVEVVGSVFQQWTAFHLAVEQQWGGLSSPQKGEKLLHDTLTFFVQSTPQDPVYADELSDFFEDTLVESFACDAEDGSCREVADAIVRQFTMCVVNGTFAEADQIIAQAPVAAARALQQSQTVPDDTSAVVPDGADGAAAAAAEPVAPVVDEDGFQMVVGKCKGRRQQVHEAAQAPQAQADVAAVQEAQAQRQAQMAAQQQQALEAQRQQELLAQQQQAQQQIMYEQQQQMLQQQEEAARAMAAQAQAEAEALAQQQRVLDEI
jgi:hypothetical protein